MKLAELELADLELSGLELAELEMSELELAELELSELELAELEQVELDLFEVELAIQSTIQDSNPSLVALLRPASKIGALKKQRFFPQCKTRKSSWHRRKTAFLTLRA